MRLTDEARHASAGRKEAEAREEAARAKSRDLERRALALVSRPAPPQFVGSVV